MINIEKKSQCTGCAACADICPVNCIKMEYDEKGFYYPVVNIEQCINCGRCESVCHFRNDTKIREERADYYVAYNKNDEELENASSGGIFWCIVKNVIARKGIVYGAISDDGIKVEHIRADKLEECKKMRKSKYQQSEINKCYEYAKRDLEEGKEVLFSGTPCQISALYAYVGKEYNNLLTVEVVCHGVPSKKVLEIYLQHIKEIYKSRVEKIVWRNKCGGWEPNKVRLCLEDGREILTNSNENIYQKGFLQNLYLRPSCYECLYARLPRVADVTLGDFWGYDGRLSNENRGLSLLAITSKKGKEVFSSIKSDLEYEKVTESYCKSRCRHLWKTPKKNRYKDRIYKNLENIKIDEIQKYFSEGKLKQKLINMRKHIMKVLLKNG